MILFSDRVDTSIEVMTAMYTMADQYWNHISFVYVKDP